MNCPYKLKKNNRRSIRLKNYDYSRPGGYFITICAQNHENIFGNVKMGEMNLNEIGNHVKIIWNDLVNHCDNVVLDEYIVMPNHFHGIIFLTKPGTMAKTNKNSMKERRIMELPKIIGRFKMVSSKHINLVRKTPGIPVWQRNYWEHIIRNEFELNRIRQYIIQNPATWIEDEHYAA